MLTPAERRVWRAFPPGWILATTIIAGVTRAVSRQ